MTPRHLALLSRLGLGDPVIRTIVIHWGLGMVLGAATAVLVLTLDIAGLRTLLVHSDAEIPGAILLFAGFAVTFGSVVSATAIMFDPKRDDG